MRYRLFTILLYFIAIIFCAHVIMILLDKLFGQSLPSIKGFNHSEGLLSLMMRKHFQNELNTTLVRRDLFGNLKEDDFRSKFIMENNGKPIQSILLSTLRSGSTFTSQLLASIPNTLYYFEPLKYFIKSSRIQGPPRRDEAIDLLRTILMCNHSSSPTIRKALTMVSASFFPRSLSQSEREASKLHRTPEMTSAICRMSPFHLIKLIRLHLNLAESLLTNNLLNVKVLYLVRDPRGTMNSRKRGHFNTETYQPWWNLSSLCDDLKSEFYAAGRLIKMFPDRFKVVRYEDLTENVLPITKNLLNFLGFEMHSRVIQFIEKHAFGQTTKLRDTYGLNRDTKKTAVQWKEELSFKEIEEIQNSCIDAMQLWGYKMALNASELKEFVPYLKSDEYDSKKVILNYQ